MHIYNAAGLADGDQMAGAEDMVFGGVAVPIKTRINI